MRTVARRGALWTVVVVFTLCQGCGSHGGGATTTTAARAAGTARFTVDVASGQVSVAPLSGGTGAGRAVFDGSAIGFTSSTLLDQAGNNGVRVLNVSLTNHWGATIGQMPNGTVTGLNVIFGPMTNAAAFATDVSGQTTVSTLTSAVPHAGAAAQATDGTVFASSLSGNQILQLHSGSVSVLAGGGVAGASDGLGTSASFNLPYGVAVNPVDGAIIVADYGNNKIRRVDRTGHVYTIAGTGVAGHADGAGGAAQLNAPEGVAVNAAGVIYVASPGDNAVRSITFTGSNAQQAASYTVATLTQSLSGPRGVTVDPSGLLYVSDSGNNRIVVLDTSGSSAVIAGTGTSGGADGPGNAATFVLPAGIVWTPAGVVVAEAGANRLRLLQLATGAGATDPSQWNVALLAGPGSSGASGFTDGSGTTALFSSPLGLGASSGGGVYVADYNNNAVRYVALPTTTFNSGATGGAGNSEPVQLSNATGVVPNASLGANLPYISYAGSLAAGAGSAAQPWNFVVPQGVTAFSFTVMVEAGTALLAPPESAVGAGSPYVQVRTLAGSGANFGISNGMAADARFDQALAMALDGAGNLYVADDGFAAIRRVSPSGETSTIAGGVLNGFGDGAGNVAEFATMYGIAVTTDGTVCYVCDSTNNRIRRLALTSGADPTNSANWTVTTIAGTGAGGGNYTTPKPGNTATLTAPAGLVLDPTGDLFFTEVYGNRVRRLTFQGGDPSLAANWQVTLLAGNTQFASGNAGTTDNTNGTLATFNEPSGLAIDRASRLYVADSGNDRVRVVTIDGATSTLAGGVSGTPPEAEYADGPGATALFDSPVGVAVDSAGYVYVAEDVGNRIRMVSPSGNVTTIAGSPTTAAGVAGYLDGLGNVALFNQPFAVAVDPAGTLYVGEIKNHAIRTIQRVISAGTD